MRGAKPRLRNVVPLRGEQEEANTAREAAVKRAVRTFQPRGLNAEVRKEWNRVARILADPTVDRLKARYVDVILEYCRATVRLRNLRAAFDELAGAAAARFALDHPGGSVAPDPLSAEIHITAGRNGEQLKSHPHVAQMNETWRQWRSLVAMLGLSPTDERNLIPGQGDLFDESEQYFA